MPKLSVNQIMQRAASHQNRGEVPQALALYQSVLRAFPNNKRAQTALATIELAKAKASARNVHPPKEQLDRLSALYNQGRFSDVINSTKQLVRQFPKSFVVWNFLGAASAQICQNAQAVKAYRHAARHNPNDPSIFYSLGVVLQELNKSDAAIIAYQRALNLKPDYADAYNNLGNVLKEHGRLDAAIEAYQQTLTLKPQYVGTMTNLGNAFKEKGKLNEAIGFYQQALKIEPDHEDAHYNIGNAMQEQGRADEALLAYQRALAIKPDYAEALLNMGSTLKGKGKLNDAIGFYQRALAVRPDYAEALLNLGNALKEKGKLNEAISHYRQALKANPAYLDAVNNLISVLIETERLEDARSLAEDYLKRAPKSADLHRNSGHLHIFFNEWDSAETRFRDSIALDESKPEPYVDLAQVLYQKNRADLALLEAEKAQRIDPDFAPAYHYIAMCKAQLGDIESAFENYQKARLLKPDFTAPIIALGHLQMEKGDFHAARALFEEAATHEKAHLRAHIALARLGKIKANDPSFAVLESALPDSDDMMPDKAVAFHYALGKCYEDLKRHDEAFAHFAKGAVIKRSLVDFDPNWTEEVSDDIIATFTPEFIKQLRGNAIDSDQPIFVVGMPRSGTTLTESILASHSKVFGAGELTFLHTLFSDRLKGGSNKTGNLIAGLSPDELKRRAGSFIEQLNARAPGTPHIVDKMPANFNMVGLIHALMPNAKIVHIARNPFDTCLSCFTRSFERSNQSHTYDQIELGHYFNAYVRVMNHWHAVLPKGSFHTVHYENLVDDIDTEARRIIAHCGLEWDDACLEFYKGDRRVRTASVQQVRQPLYTTSKEKWRKYEGQLAPLIDTIGNNRIVF